MVAYGFILILGTSSCMQEPTQQTIKPVPQILPVQVSPKQRLRLPRTTTFTTIHKAPRDPQPFEFTDGHVLHPTEDRVIFTRPGGPPLAVLPSSNLKSPTWVPVVRTLPGWHQVLLPSKPNRSSGWIYAEGGGLQNAYSPYRIHIELNAHRLTLHHAKHRLRSWTVAVGARATPTPTGRTFLLASLYPDRPTYSPRILPLGAHSSTLDSYGGGSGTVALHGWPDKSVFGRNVSHGCVRVPRTALRLLSRIPLGTPVLISP
jgi:hypothetical protein